MWRTVHKSEAIVLTVRRKEHGKCKTEMRKRHDKEWLEKVLLDILYCLVLGQQKLCFTMHCEALHATSVLGQTVSPEAVGVGMLSHSWICIAVQRTEHSQGQWRLAKNGLKRQARQHSLHYPSIKIELLMQAFMRKWLKLPGLTLL